MNRDMLAFIAYAYNRHCCDGHLSEFDYCQRRTCKRARQLEVYLTLTGQWLDAAYEFLTRD